MNTENLRKMFPQFKITDATDRTPDQLARIQRISGNVNNSFVFIERNKKNEKFFMHMERVDKEVIGSYGHIILTTLHIHFVRKRKDYTGYLLHLKRLYDDEIDCVVCFDSKLKSFVYCNQCASACCCDCYYKIESDACPTCRHESFTKMMIDSN